jgi:hypothetical protein
VIYMQGKNGQHIIILEPSNLDQLKTGRVVHTPDNDKCTLLMYSPDIVWTGTQIKKAFHMADGSIDVEELQRIVDESQSRPEIRERPYHHTELISGRREGQKPQ